jgi:hypothetical protein
MYLGEVFRQIEVKDGSKYKNRVIDSTNLLIKFFNEKFLFC